MAGPGLDLGPVAAAAGRGQEPDGLTGAPRPWGIGRLGPYPRTVRQPFTTVEIDPVTRLGRVRAVYWRPSCGGNTACPDPRTRH
ncbi:putative ATP-grasp-modified RiPP [Streptomyces sp. TRM64462]|uniref:putative ATP-grasp-modified RiPP n=1 Tax=Streptomyces sp. TRM64462 TaxID=2741726 RepID=UPI0028160027|nr:putative ATP-grasp-modified RiPP [Streptomyces sp. TRM64462]